MPKEDVFTNLPLWEVQRRQGLAEKGHPLFEEALNKGVYGPRHTEEVKRLVAKANKKFEKHNLTRDQPGFPLEVVPGLEVKFSPDELIAISQDDNYARRVYSLLTTNRNPNEATVQTFQDSVTSTYPTIATIGAEIAERKFRDHYSPFPEHGDTARVLNSRFSAVRKNALEAAESSFPPVDPKIKNQQLREAMLQDVEIKLLAENEGLSLEQAIDHSSEIYGVDEAKKRVTSQFDKTLNEERKKHVALAKKQFEDVESAFNRLIQRDKFTPQSVAEVRRRLGPTLPESVFADYIVPSTQDYLEKEQQAEVKKTQTPLNRLDKEATFKRLGKLAKLQDITQQGVRLAPFGPLHKEVEGLIRRSQRTSEEQGEQEKTRAARLESTSPPGADVLEEWQRGRKALETLDTPIEEQVNRLMQQYWNPAQKERERLSERQWEEQIRPSIQNVYGSMGLHDSPALQQALKSGREKLAEQVRGESALSQERTLQQALQAAYVQQQRALEKAKTHGDLSRQQQEHLIRQEAAIQSASTQRKGRDQADIATLSQLAHQKQDQDQKELNERRLMAEEERELPLQLLERQMALPLGRGPVYGSSISTTPLPSAPSALATGLGTVSTLASQLLKMGQAEQGKAKGGSIKNRFTAGGMPTWQGIGQQVEADKYHKDQQKIAQVLGDYKFNPLANFLGRIGTQLMGAGKEDMHHAVRKGLEQHTEDETQAYDKSLNAKQMASNIYDKMQQSLLQQKHFLAEYEAKKAGHEETGRYHDILDKHYKGLEGLKAAKIDNFLEKEMRKDKELSKEDQKVIDEETDTIRQTTDLLSVVGELEEVYSRLDTGPQRGSLAEKGHDSTAAYLGLGNINDITKARTFTNNMISMFQEMKKRSPRAFAHMKFLMTAKPNFVNTKSTNLNILAKTKEEALRSLITSKEKLKRHKMSDVQIEDYVNQLSSVPSQEKKKTKEVEKGEKSSPQTRREQLQDLKNKIIKEREEEMGTQEGTEQQMQFLG